MNNQPGTSADHVERKGSSTLQINKGLRRSYDVNFKLMVVAEAERTNNLKASKKFGVSESNIRLWRKDSNKYRSACSTRKSFRGPKKGRFDEIEKRVTQFIVEKRNEGLPITREMIQLKGLEEAKQLNVSREIFKASLGWCKRLMKRQGLSLRRRTSLAQRLPRDFEEKLLSFQRHIITLRKKHNYELKDIANADQTPVFFDMPSNLTVNKKGEKSIIIKTTGNERARLTVMLCVTGDGNKLPPYVILKRKTLPKETLPPGIIFRVQEKGWMTEDLVLDWLRVVWARRPGCLKSPRSMLVLDAFRGHLTTRVKSYLKNHTNSDLVIIPGGMTSKLQVLDVAVNKLFKDNLRKQYNAWLLGGDHPLTPTGKIKKPSIVTIAEWIKTSWEKIPSETIIKGFKRCCITNNLDGSEDDVLWQNEVIDSSRNENHESSSDSDVSENESGVSDICDD